MASRRPTSLLVLALAAALAGGCGDDKSPPVDASKVGPRGALKSQAMQDQMAKGDPRGPVPGAAK